MERLQLKADIREQKGKGVARQLRREGLVPGVVYGLDRQPVNLKLNAKETGKVIGGNAIIDLVLDNGDTETVMVKDVQRHPVKGDLFHVDLYRINMDEKITIEVPVELVGTAMGTREGGILEQILREIEIECLPTNIPQNIQVDVTELNIGQSLNVSEIDAGDITILTDESETVATVVAPEAVIEPEEEEEVTEPEVIGEEPEEEEADEE
ncbi:50S ribosomal protein L25 [Orenia marismortui]|uniref:Large ribosomal subunit protein bL25 n=1 Tax=Orenia marismortui TaxID=46469 RepID=A0A4R8GY02_9FIRM|nr:50S ribosomal protein L25 [Orenia marismortui]TDX51265.1 LSU ribosomal protein L25P [Orenia marismortui]